MLLAASLLSFQRAEDEVKFIDGAIASMNGILLANIAYWLKDTNAYYFVLGAYFIGSLLCALNWMLVLPDTAGSIKQFALIVSTGTIPITTGYFLISIDPLARFYSSARVPLLTAFLP